MSSFPYPGLRPFKRDETKIFFGREEQIDQLLEKLEQARFIAVVGPSGCGKSSLVRTGLLAALESGLLLSAGPRWCIADHRPGNRPLARLAEALLREPVLGTERLSTSNPQSKVEAAAYLQATLNRGPLGLRDVLDDTPLPANSNLLLLVDQFEEIFRYHRHGGRDEANAYVSLLLESAKQRKWPIYVVLTMRSDFIGDCTLFQDLPQTINQSQFLTPRLTRQQLQAAIQGPARVYGGRVESDLVNRLLNDAGTDPDQLPLMQHALMRMWSLADQGGTNGETIILNLATYDKVGGLKDALSQHADEALDELTESQKRIAEHLFRAMCERGSKLRDTRRSVVLREVAKVLDVAIEKVSVVVDVFRTPERSLIMPPQPHVLSPDTVLDISHESLIRQWKTLSQWVEQEAQSAEVYTRLEKTASLWELNKAALWGTPDLENALAWHKREKPNAVWASRYGKDFETAIKFLNASSKEQEGKKIAEEEAQRYELERIRKERAWAIIGLLLALTLAIWGFWERNKAREQGDRAEEAKNIAIIAREDATKARNKAEIERNKAFEALNKMKEAQSQREMALIQAEKERDKSEIALKKAEVSRQQAKVSQEAATQAKEHAETTEIQRTLDLFESRLLHASLLAHVENYAKAKDYLTTTYELDDRIPENRLHSRNLLAWFTGLMGIAPNKVFSGAGAPLYKIAISPDGSLIAAGGENGTLVLVNRETGKMKRLKGHEMDVHNLQFHPGGDWLVSAGEDKRIIFWSLPEGRRTKIWQAPAQVWGLAISSDGNLLASGGTDNEITLWEMKTGRKQTILKGHKDTISRGLTFSPDNQLLASASYDQTARIWEIQSGNSYPLEGHTNSLEGITFHPNGDSVATSSSDHTIRVWNTKSGKTNTVLRGHQNIVTDITYTPNHKFLISASYDRTLRVWDTESGITLRVLHNLTTGVTDAKTYGDQLFSTSNDGTIKSWNFSSDYPMTIIDLHGEPASAAISPDTSKVAIGFANGDLNLYSLESKRWIWQKKAVHNGDVQRLDFSPDGQLIASASFDNTTRLVRTKDGSEHQKFESLQDAVHDVKFAPDNNRLAMASYDGQIGLFNVGKIKGLFIQAHAGRALSVNFDASGNRLLTSGADGATRLWDLLVVPPKIILDFPKAQDNVTSSAISPDGKFVASVGRDSIVRVYRTSDGKEAMSLIGHENTVFRVAFSPDSSTIASVSSDATVRIWDLEAQIELFTLKLPTNSGRPTPLWDFDFHCATSEDGEIGECLIVVPLTRGKLVVYNLGEPF